MSSIKKQFISGVFYTAAAKYIGLIIQLVITGILSRLLTPEDFGVMAIANVFIIFFNLLSDFGIGSAIIQNKTLDEDDIKHIFTFSIYVGIGLALAFFIAAPLIASFYRKAILGDICRLLSLNVLFASLNVVPNSLLLRGKQFRFIAGRTLSIQIISGIVGISAAFSGFGIYSLLIYSIVSSFILFSVNYFKKPIGLSLKLDLSPLKKIFNYSVYQFFFNFVNYFSRNLDKLLIGRFLSPALLGYYDKAYRLMLLPIENLTHVLSPVIHPFFSEFQSDKRKIFEGYLKIVYFLAIVGFPLSAYLHFTARELIFIIFGNQWEAAVPVFRILSWSVGIQIVLSSSGSIFLAANNTRLLFVSGLLAAVMMILGTCYGVFIVKELTGVAYGLLAAFFANFIQCYILLVVLVLKSSLSRFLAILKKPLILFGFIQIGEYIFVRFIKIDAIIVSFIVKSLVVGGILAISLIVSGDYKTIKLSILSLRQR